MGKTLEQLQQAVVDTEAAYYATIDPYVEAAAYFDWCKARLDLSDYLKEHGDD